MIDVLVTSVLIKSTYTRGSNDGTYSDGDILGSRKEPVDQDTHERRVQAIFRWKLGKRGIRHTLRNDNGANGDT